MIFSLGRNRDLTSIPLDLVSASPEPVSTTVPSQEVQLQHRHHIEQQENTSGSADY